MGSKARHAKQILPIILKDRKPNQWYVEPFVGGANVIDKVDGNRIGADINPYVIAMLNALGGGWVPPKEITKPTYDKYRKRYYQSDITDAHLTGYIGINGSYNGRFYDGGYAGVTQIKGGGVRNYPLEAFNNIMKQAPLLSGIVFECCSYTDLQIPDMSIIYCDPPYQNSKEYRAGSVLPDEFWQWCRDKHSQGHQVFISEYSAPDDFICVWEKQVNSSLTKNTGAKKATEKLFTL